MSHIMGAWIDIWYSISKWPWSNQARGSVSSKRAITTNLRPLKISWCSRKSPKRNNLRMPLLQQSIKVSLQSCPLGLMHLKNMRLQPRQMWKPMIMDWISTKLRWSKSWSCPSKTKRDLKYKKCSNKYHRWKVTLNCPSILCLQYLNSKFKPRPLK